METATALTVDSLE